MSSINSIRLPGLATGMDTEKMIKEMLAGEQKKIDKAKQKEQNIKWQQEIYREIIKDVKDINEKYFSVTSKNSLINSNAWNTLSITSSDSSIVTATGNAGANNIDYKFDVEKLAEPPKITAKTDSDGNQIKRDSKLSELGLTSGKNFKINLGGDSNSKSITIEPDDTIDSLVSKINNSMGGDVKASFSDMTGEFTIESSKTGKNSELKIVNEDGSISDSLNFLGLGTKVYETDADGNFVSGTDGKSKFTIEKFGGSAVGSNSIIKVSSKDGSFTKTLNEESNSFTIDSVTYNVFTTGSANMTSKQDVKPAVDNMKSFVEEYNKIMDKVYKLVVEKKQSDYQPLTEAQKEDMSEEEIERWEKKAKQGILRNDSEMRRFMDDMQKSIFGDKMEILSEMGLTSHEDYTKKGQIALDESKFTKALETNSNRVYEAFAKDSSSILESMKNTMKKYVGGSSSIFARKAGLTASSANNFYSEQLKRQAENIKTLTRKMSDKESSLYQKFAKLESSMNKFNSQMNYFAQA
ncbi:flagellar filament capping protein FliD [[Clostridium] dakarense]|uniref:flagellar filament capping protein FliD n=1 Tax=Faecalimicrobium dakarense TaxID=1301100 RepID=UPI0004B91605|nr:flagellar filament capping protein FliD [[Clostridium] dakarense]